MLDRQITDKIVIYLHLLFEKITKIYNPLQTQALENVSKMISNITDQFTETTGT